MGGHRDDNGETPSGERAAGIRVELDRLRKRLRELQRDAPQPPPPRPIEPEATSIEPADALTPAPPRPPEAEPAATSTALSIAAPSGRDIAAAAPAAITVTSTPVSVLVPWTPARRARNGFHLALHLAQRPAFCCCCWCLTRPDAKRAKRIFAIVRAVKRAERAAQRR